MGKKEASTLIKLQLDDLKLELQKTQQALYFWRSATITIGIFVVTLILYIWGKRM